MRRPSAALAVLACLLATQVAAGGTQAPDPFAFLRPTVIVTDADRRQLARGEPVARVIAARDREVTVFAAVPVAIDADRLVAWVRDIAGFKQSRYVRAIQRFSDPPRIEDLATLDLEDGDLSAIRKCRRGDCGLKLSGIEMETLRRVVDGAGTNWRPAAVRAFRQLVLDRVRAYLAGGHAALGDYDDARRPLSPGMRFSILLERTTFLTEALPDLAHALGGSPAPSSADGESFLYWSQEGLAGKPIISATHVHIARSADGTGPDVLAASKSVFATHYVSASLGVTALVHDGDGARYLVYVNRSELDMLSGFFGGLVRMIIERRLKSEAGEVLRGLRRRLESGMPPGTGPAERASALTRVVRAGGG